MLRASDQILFQKLGNEAVILHLNSEQYFGLDEIGTQIWETLMEEKDIDVTVSILSNEYDVDSAVLRNDILELIAELKKEQILVDEL